MKLWFQGKQVGKPRVRQYALLGNAWLEKESAILCPGSSPTSPDVMAQAVSSSLRGMSPYLRTIPGFCDEPNPVLRNVINSCQVQRVPPVLKLPGSLSFSFFSCEQPGGHSCVSLMLLSPKTSPGPHRVDAPSKICQWINVPSALLFYSFFAKDPNFKIGKQKFREVLRSEGNPKSSDRILSGMDWNLLQACHCLSCFSGNAKPGRLNTQAGYQWGRPYLREQEKERKVRI